VSIRWWPWHPLANPYPYPALPEAPPCNCTPPPLITVAQADAYMASTLKAEAWAALGSVQKARALKSSQDSLRTLRWCTDEETCCGKELTASYVAAASELALVLYGNSTAVLGASSQVTAPVVSMERLGDLEQRYFSPGDVMGVLPRDRRVGSHSPTVLRLYPWLLDLVGCWIDRGNDGERAIRILRG
jgi:hypothetical protein